MDKLSTFLVSPNRFWQSAMLPVIYFPTFYQVLKISPLFYSGAYNFNNKRAWTEEGFVNASAGMLYFQILQLQ